MKGLQNNIYTSLMILALFNYSSYLNDFNTISLSKCLFLHPTNKNLFIYQQMTVYISPLNKTVINKLIYQNMVQGPHRKIMTNVIIHHHVGNGKNAVYIIYWNSFPFLLLFQLAEILKYYLHFDNFHKIQFNSLNIKINWSPGTGAHFERDYYSWAPRDRGVS